MRHVYKHLSAEEATKSSAGRFGTEGAHSVFPPVQIVLVGQFEQAAPSIVQHNAGVMDHFGISIWLQQQHVEPTYLICGVKASRPDITYRALRITSKFYGTRRICLIHFEMSANRILDQKPPALPSKPGVRLSHQWHQVTGTCKIRKCHTLKPETFHGAILCLKNSCGAIKVDVKVSICLSPCFIPFY